MKPAMTMVLLAGLAACTNPDREWAKKCVARGFGNELCNCVAEKVPAKQREALTFLAENSFGGGWVLVPNEESAATCSRYVDQARAASKP